MNCVPVVAALTGAAGGDTAVVDGGATAAAATVVAPVANGPVNPSAKAAFPFGLVLPNPHP